MVVASDEWHPSFPGGRVCLTWNPDDARISVWGDDDFGMEKIGTTHEEFLQLKNLVLSVKLLKSRGFVNA